MILAVDPSIREYGYAVLNVDDRKKKENWVEDSGCIKTSSDPDTRLKSKDRVHRVQNIFSELNRICTMWGIEHVVSELPAGSQSATAAWTLGSVVGGTASLAISLDIDIDFFTLHECKQSVEGIDDTPEGVSKKEYVAIKMKDMYNAQWEDTKYIDLAVSDSLAVFETAIQKGVIDCGSDKSK